MKEIKEYETVKIDVDQILIDEANPNKMTPEEEKRLQKSMEEFGNTQDIIVDSETMILADGEHRLNEYKKKGITKIPVKLVPFKNDAARRAYRQAANKIRGTHDPELDASEYLKIMEAGETDLLKIATGMTIQDVTGYLRKHELLGKEEEPFDADEQAKAIITPISEYGDVWILGDSKIMCGDSTKEEDVLKLMGEEKASMSFTDPPYGVSYKGTNNPNGKDWGVMSNDDLRTDELYDFLVKSFSNIAKVTKANPALYSCYASSNHTIFEKALEDSGWKIKQQLIWDKGMVLGHSDYHWTHEPILYAVKKDKNCEWYGDRSQVTLLKTEEKDLEGLNKAELIALLMKLKGESTIVKIKKDFAGFYMHPTQKPIELPMKIIKNNTMEGDLVYEPFSGSGSTLLACVKMGRKCYAMELDPRYADVAVRRWENLTNGKAYKL